MKKIAILGYNGCWGMGVFSASDFFRIVSLLERHLGIEPQYQISVFSVDGADITSASGVTIKADAALNPDNGYALVVIPPIEGPQLTNLAATDRRVLDWLRTHRDRGGQVLAMTTGVGLIAAAGLAEHSILSTHWAYVRQLKQLYPAQQFVARRSVMQSDGIWTTGTLNGAFDALLEIVAADCGDQFAQLCAAHLLVSAPERLNPILPGYRNHTDDAILRLQDWIEVHHGEALTIEQMAQEVRLTERTLKRRFLQATQVSPIVYLQKIRVDKAKKLLLATNLSVKAISYEVGYENVSFFVRLFKSQAGQTPAAWRKGASLTAP